MTSPSQAEQNIQLQERLKMGICLLLPRKTMIERAWGSGVTATPIAGAGCSFAAEVHQSRLAIRAFGPILTALQVVTDSRVNAIFKAR